MGSNKPVPIQEIKRRGTYRKDRHTDRELADKLFDKTIPDMPKGLPSKAQEHWKFLLDNVPHEILCHADEKTLKMLCWLWDEFEFYIVSDDLSERRNALNAAKQWVALGEKYGLTPTGRAALKGVPEKEKEHLKSVLGIVS